MKSFISSFLPSILFLFSYLLCVNRQNSSKYSNNNEPQLFSHQNFIYTDSDSVDIIDPIDEIATFPGGEVELKQFIKANLKYPSLAKSNGITGKVYVSFIVAKNGKIKEARIMRGIGAGCDEEALRIVNSMPRWIPPKQNGKSISSRIYLPVVFD